MTENLSLKEYINGNYNCVVGPNNQISGNYNCIIGYNNKITGNNCVIIGSNHIVEFDNTVIIDDGRDKLIAETQNLISKKMMGNIEKYW